jgi:2-haloacid dehalogenase
VPGLTRLRDRFVIATLSNGNVAMLTNMAKNAGLPWDCILSSELARHYKPDPEVYQTAADLLGLDTREVLMVAAHPFDLKAAQAVGMQAAYVSRPLEFGPGRQPEDASGEDFQIHAADFEDLAGQLSC